MRSFADRKTIPHFVRAPRRLFGNKKSNAAADLPLIRYGVQSHKHPRNLGCLNSETIANRDRGTFGRYTFNDPRVLIVPMADFTTAQSRSKVLVKGFAALWLVSVNNKNNIKTYFIDQAAPGSTPDSAAPNYDAYKAVVTQ